MMKLRLSLKNSVKAALNSLFLICLLLLLAGCSLSVEPTYIKETVDKAIQDVCRKEYKLDVKTKMVGQTLWIYLPMEDIFIKNEKPEKYTERFLVSRVQEVPSIDSLRFEYQIESIPAKERKEKTQEYKYSDKVIEQINNVWRVIRRVTFSIDRSKGNEPKFYCLIVSDIKNGLEISEAFYHLDFKKFSYEYISRMEYQHRIIQGTNFTPEALGDKEGIHIIYRDISLKEFVAAQIQQRIQLKFQRTEAEKDVDVDKEILKIAVHTLKIYNFKDFDTLELDNLVTNNKTLLNRAAVWASPTG